jgi:glycosyltransferase involved in cell wall biosynthesis
MSIPITVLMSVYNGERWLSESIESVLSQSYSNFEFIIINDGSTDASLEIINSFAVRDSRINIIDKPNTGLADSLNVGINQAQGEWIARIDADDLCEPDRLHKQYGLVRMKPSLVLIGSDFQVIDEEGRPGKMYKCSSKHKSLVNSLATGRRFFPHSSSFYHSETVRLLGGYRTRIKRAQDRDLWLRLCEAGQITCLSESLVKIRKHPNQITHEEQGLRQKADSRVAIASFWLRQRSLVDPVAAYSDEDFEYFRNWVVDCLRKDGLFEYSAFMQQVKKELAVLGIFSGSLVTLSTLLLRKPSFVLRYLRESILGEQLPKVLAARWEQEIKACVNN